MMFLLSCCASIVVVVVALQMVCTIDASKQLHSDMRIHFHDARQNKKQPQSLRSPRWMDGLVVVVRPLEMEWEESVTQTEGLA